MDDILITGEESSAITSLIHDLNLTFSLKDLGLVRYFLCFEVSRTPSGLHLSQMKYASDLLSCTNLADAKPNPTSMCLGHKLYLSNSLPFDHPFLYRNTVGALQYLTLISPDIAYTVNKFSQFLHAPTIAHWAACKRLLHYIKGTIHYGLFFHPAKVFSLKGYSDVDWATSIDDRKFVSGVFIFLGGNLISWSFKKQSVVARSSTESKYCALASAASELKWIHQLLNELGIRLQTSSPLFWCDNMGA